MAYPKFVIDTKKLKRNAKNVLDMCNEVGIEVVGVVKGINGLDEIIQVLIDAGFKILAFS